MPGCGNRTATIDPSRTKRIDFQFPSKKPPSQHAEDAVSGERSPSINAFTQRQQRFLTRRQLLIEGCQ